MCCRKALWESWHVVSLLQNHQKGFAHLPFLSLCWVRWWLQLEARKTSRLHFTVSQHCTLLSLCSYSTTSHSTSHNTGQQRPVTVWVKYMFTRCSNLPKCSLPLPQVFLSFSSGDYTTQHFRIWVIDAWNRLTGFKVCQSDIQVFSHQLNACISEL